LEVLIDLPLESERAQAASNPVLMTLPFLGALKKLVADPNQKDSREKDQQG
jgi:hypothetical protein